MLDGGALLGRVLEAVRAQELDREVELLVVDSGSADGSPELARAGGARVLEIARSQFSHGGTRNLIVREAWGSHVAFLTQDAEPADRRWLARLLAGFDLADDVGLVCGPYVARPDARVSVRRELAEFFASFAPDRRPRIDRGSPPGHPGPVTFFSSANGCVARAAWERVPFREAPYAEDQLLAREMLSAGFAKVFVPDAAVLHSHEYGALGWFRRFFDEWRGLLEVYGHVEAVGPRQTPRRIARELRADYAFLRDEGARGAQLARGAASALEYHAARALGSALGSRADRLPPRLRRSFSLEGREGFEPYDGP